jgi:ureidoglycolate lyase
MSDVLRQYNIAVKEATTATLEGFGSVLGRANAVHPDVSDFMPEVELRKPVSFVSDETTMLSLATVHRRDFEVRWLERHYKHTQTFIPLGGRPFVMAMAKPTETECPEAQDVESFLFDGTTGFTMNIGTWHEFPFALVDYTDIVVVLRSETNRNLKNINNNEASGDDLDKRDVTKRLGARINISL